jgi:ATP-dependent helicase/nuclease subunit B
MRILFGMYLDGTVWSSQTSCIGEVRTGSWGLLAILETHLGLSGLSVHPATRIDEYLQCIEKIDHATAWFHESLAVDPWSTARQLLAWRDELIAGGWQDARVD